MRSLIILEVEHGEDTDNLEELINKILLSSPNLGAPVRDYTVKVDLPDCFVLDAECDCDIDILDPNCTNTDHINPPEGF